MSKKQNFCTKLLVKTQHTHTPYPFIKTHPHTHTRRVSLSQLRQCLISCEYDSKSKDGKMFNCSATKTLSFMLINACPPTVNLQQKMSINSRALVFSKEEQHTGMMFELVNNKLFSLEADLELSFGQLSLHA